MPRIVRKGCWNSNAPHQPFGKHKTKTVVLCMRCHKILLSCTSFTVCVHNAHTHIWWAPHCTMSIVQSAIYIYICSRQSQSAGGRGDDSRSKVPMCYSYNLQSTMWASSSSLPSLGRRCKSKRNWHNVRATRERAIPAKKGHVQKCHICSFAKYLHVLPFSVLP